MLKSDALRTHYTRLSIDAADHIGKLIRAHQMHLKWDWQWQHLVIVASDGGGVRNSGSDNQVAGDDELKSPTPPCE